MPKLLISLPDAGEVVHELSGASITIGRVEDNTIQIDDASVSSHHAELILDGEDYFLRDLGSTNGTQLNGQPFTQGKLQGGDHVRFGKIDAVYESKAPASPRPLPTQQEPAHAQVASSSSRPGDFANASPFQKKGKKKDASATATWAVAVVAILAFVASALVIVSVEAPRF